MVLVLVSGEASKVHDRSGIKYICWLFVVVV